MFGLRAISILFILGCWSSNYLVISGAPSETSTKHYIILANKTKNSNRWTGYQPSSSLFDIMKNKKEINREFADLFFPFLVDAKPRGMFTYTSMYLPTNAENIVSLEVNATMMLNR